ncbi:ubl carboxyl-terminal hydrolase 18 isoform X3 [Puntigrus tetrazona]|uniref:ubl carboxyl-terminal hydrolase 18 isoform X3 n=1 Tax=Puntigrus tetrazona TaxID=1606681 RepID=UPI001C89110D|nr:ubl carboxyl-terminal hydrolase 18 isoform X3 [Puntigrus tetrazona]
MGRYCSKMAYRFYSGSGSLGYEVRGLLNYNLSCCTNALLQSFSATTELLDILNKWHPSDETDERNVLLQLKNALEAMRDKSHPAPHKDFLKCLYYQAVRPSTQQDADEIFHIILNLSQKQMPDAAVAQEIRSLFEIQVENQVVCSECTYIHRAPSSLFSLPLAIFERDTLESCIKSFFMLQELPDSEKAYCDRCAEKRPSTHEADYVKTNEYYSLYAVIVHEGHMFGHYTAFIRSNQEEMWYYADDCRVRPSTWADVQDTYGGSHQYGSTAYLLLYRKKSRNLSA